MKYLLMMMAVLCYGCSDQTKSGEQTGKEITARLRSPIEKTSAITDKIKATREVEVPK